ncbi:MAG: translation initiation factor IF-1 [Candidatus Pacebacteria bacterium CG_4_10_14_0_8_um_filter_43_12]|nr:MAG: translation initiation factor IF-1 [Candidatus Pacebacteria bacterium CG10_big_fil_rev_8_21_14_0_10_44_11]PIY79537.1 MAG: translation initiation factor IF-1 [Candidatus Pacebacteria bacterium CG_4_10_14_0_8_um_filter_43_12]
MGKVQEHKRAAKARHQVDTTTQSSVKEDRFEVEGVVEACLPNTMFRVKIIDSQIPQLVGHTLLGSLVGKMRLFRIRVLPGDSVKGYVSKYDLGKCKITYRSTKTTPQSF